MQMTGPRDAEKAASRGTMERTQAVSSQLGENGFGSPSGILGTYPNSDRSSAVLGLVR